MFLFRDKHCLIFFCSYILDYSLRQSKASPCSPLAITHIGDLILHFMKGTMYPFWLYQSPEGLILLLIWFLAFDFIERLTAFFGLSILFFVTYS